MNVTPDLDLSSQKLNLLFITREPDVAAILERCDVDWVFVDLETVGKAERQAGRNTVKSDHTIEDVSAVRQVLSRLRQDCDKFRQKSRFVV